MGTCDSDWRAFFPMTCAIADMCARSRNGRHEMLMALRARLGVGGGGTERRALETDPDMGTPFLSLAI